MNRWRPSFVLSLGLASLAALPVRTHGEEPATPAASETLFLKSGDELVGTSVGLAEGELRWKLPSGGIVSIPLESIQRLDIPPEVAGESGKGAEAGTEVPAEEAAEPEKTSAVKADSPAENVEKDDASKADPKVETAAAIIEPEGIDPHETAPEELPDPVLSEPLPLTDAWYEAARSTYAFSAEQTGAWTKRFEFGGTWVEGNSNTTEAYVGGVFERQYERVFHQLDWNGRHTSADGEVTQSRWQLNGTTDFSKNKEGKWILFGTHKHLFDQLADLNYRGTFASGIGYRIFNEKEKRLIARVGPGTTIEKYDPPEGTRLTFDAFSEIEARWPILDRTHLEYKSTFTPSLEDISVFRVTSNYGLLVALDDSEAWAMKLGLQHDHNSEPNPDLKKNDFTTMFSVVYSRK